MVRSLTFAFVTFGTAAVLSAQAPAPSTARPPADQPAAQQPAEKPYTPAPAQTPSPAAEPATQQPATTTSTSQMSSTTTAGQVTYSGCLKPGPTAGSWVLESAQLAPAAGASSSAQAPVGTSGANSRQTLLLVTKPTDDLTAHANHQIQVVGSVAPSISTSMSSSSSAPGAASPSTSTTTTTSSSASARTTFNVDSFKMVSSSCK